MNAEVHKIRPETNSRMRCSQCAAFASCGCGAPYISAGEFAARECAKLENQEKSDGVLAKEIGVDRVTVRNARKATCENSQVESGASATPEKRRGRDGKMRSTKRKVSSEPKLKPRRGPAQRDRVEKMVRDAGLNGVDPKIIADELCIKPETIFARFSESRKKDAGFEAIEQDGKTIYRFIGPEAPKIDREKEQSGRIKDLERELKSLRARLEDMIAADGAISSADRMQRKLAVAKREIKELELRNWKLRSELEEKIYMPLRERMEKWQREYLESQWPKYEKEKADCERVMKSRSGVFTQVEYNQIVFCLHPDQFEHRTHDQVQRAFVLLNAKRLVLLSEKEMPTSYPPLPKTLVRK